MITIAIIFWVLLGLIIYSYLGYTIVIVFLNYLKQVFFNNPNQYSHNELPEVTLLVAAYNEKDHVKNKMDNSLSLNYPKDKLKIMWVTDGSNDGTPELLKAYPEVILLHQDERKGKIAAMNRAMKHVDTPIAVFSDGNTLLGNNSIMKIVDLFANPKVGCIAGEKRIVNKDSDTAAGSGEGIYWKYESFIKRTEAKLNSVVGAAGELFAIRTDLFQEVEPDTLLDDFIISLRIASKGYTVQYDPEAYAIEVASANVKEEIKRKIRIAAGGFQSMGRLKHLLNPFKHGLLSFQYVSHKVSRWAIAPLALLLIIPLNFILALLVDFKIDNIYTLLFYGQCAFYLLVVLGWKFEQQKIKLKFLFVPYYLYIMNYAAFLGFFRFLKGSQSVLWERAKRG